MSLLLLLNEAETHSALRPTVQDVALLERTRTVTAGGGEEITFTESTRPSASEVSGLIDQALPAILAHLPEAFSEAYYDRARHLVALYTALLIEGSYFREQLDNGSAALWRDLLTTGLASLRTEIEAVQGTGQWSVVSLPITTVVAQSSPFLGSYDLLP